MKTFVVGVSEDLNNYMERLSFELTSRERVIKAMLGDSSFENQLENDNFKSYHKEFEEKLFEYETAKTEAESSIIPEVLRNHEYQWDWVFRDSVMKVTFKCNCFDKAPDNATLEELIQYA